MMENSFTLNVAVNIMLAYVGFKVLLTIAA